jgi:hypothetical protein
LRHCVKSWKVLGSIPDEVIGFLSGPNPSSRTMALGSTQLLTEMSTRYLPEDKEWSARDADDLSTICEPLVQKMWEPHRLTTLWASMVCYRDSLLVCTVYDFSVFFMSLLVEGPG